MLRAARVVGGGWGFGGDACAIDFFGFSAFSLFLFFTLYVVGLDSPPPFSRKEREENGLPVTSF